MFHIRTGHITALITLLSTAALPQTGFAASYADALPKGQKTAYSASLTEFTDGDAYRKTHTLDWRQPTLQLYFDLPPAERTSEIVLTLSADPLTTVARNAPLQVQFNNSKPVPVRSNGRGFEARIPFDAAKSRTHHNSLRITFPTPKGEECVTPAHGEWSVDLAASTIRIAGRAKRRNMSLAEVENRLMQPALAPKKVGLLARGPNGPDMQALAAQGISLRTPEVPKFSVTSHGNDFNIVMVKRDRLYEVTNDPMILNSKGARAFVPKGRPTELIFTAETDAEIVQMLQIFATRSLPNTRRPITSLGELNLQNRLDSGIVKIDRKARLSELGSGQSVSGLGVDSWASGSQSYRFSVTDPVATGGELLLRLATTDDVAKSSRLRVALNGEILGAAKLDRKRKSVIFDIEPGKMNATSNVLSILPELNANPGYSCPSLEAGRPSFTIGHGSRLKLTSGTPSPVTELSRLTSTGGIFATTESYIVLPRSTRDFQASLRILGRMAKSAGQGFTQADYTREDNLGSDKHVLVIGPSKVVRPYLSTAPKALREAMQGKVGSGDNLLKANIERFASSGANDFAVRFAATQTKSRKVNRGGVAGLYGSGHGKLMGVISSAPGESFVRTVDQIIQPAHWNALQGGVARWNKTSVLMTQTAQAAPNIKLPKPKKALDLQKFEFPDMNFSEISWPDFDVPQVSWSDIDWPKINRSKRNETRTVAVVENVITEPVVKPVAKKDIYAPVQPAATAPEFRHKPAPVKMAEIAPRLKPVSSRPVKLSSQLRGKFEFDSTASRQGSFQDLRRVTKQKWVATKHWLKAKTKGASELKAVETLSTATDRLQDQVKPAGRSMRDTLKDKLPGKGLVQIGDRTVSVFGLMLMLAFGLVLILMSLASPKSRLGGRH